MGFLQTLLSGGASTLVDSVGKVLDDVSTSKEEKLNLNLELQKAQMQYETDMKKMNNEERQMNLADTASARQMAQTIQTSAAAPWLAKNISPILAIVTILITFTLFYLILFEGDEKMVNDKKDIILYILGALSAITTQIFSFYFGSSTGSSSKNDMLQKQLDYHTHKNDLDNKTLRNNK